MGGIRLWTVMLVAAGMLAGCSEQHHRVRPHAHVVVAPASSLSDRPQQIVVRGVGADRKVTLELRSVDAHRVTFASRATFRSDRSGDVDLGSSPATAGSYRGVDLMGLIDTMQPTSRRDHLYFWSGHPQSFHITVMEDGSQVASDGFTRRLSAPGVTVSDESLASTGFYGQFWRPPAGDPRRAAVLEFGGSEGGLDGQLLGAALASAGHPTLDIAYFGEPGLPANLRDIPLGYFAGALRWLARQPEVAAGQTYVSGPSRGSEAALLLAVHYPTLVHGVIASSPSDLSFGPYPPAQGFAAWTYHGKPVPYSRVFSAVEPIQDPSAEIAVQRIHGPVLLDCGTDDHVWTSCAYAQAIQRRLASAHDRFPHVLYRYRGAGHFVNELVPFEPNQAATPTTDGNGDTLLANENADARLWPRVLSFLADPARTTGTFTAPATAP